MNPDQNGYNSQSRYTTSKTTGESSQHNYQFQQLSNLNNNSIYRPIHTPNQQNVPHHQQQPQPQHIPMQIQSQPMYNSQYHLPRVPMNLIQPIRSSPDVWSTVPNINQSSIPLRNDENTSHAKTLNNDVKLLERSSTIKLNVKTSARSNKGCLTCKSRKHKCDEVKPICNECARINMKCIYALKGFVNMDSVNLEGSSQNDSGLISKTKVKPNETYIEGIGSIKILRAKVDRKLVNGKVVYRA